jgi:hypothetical protein
MQIGRICTIPDLARPDCASVQAGTRVFSRLRLSLSVTL